MRKTRAILVAKRGGGIEAFDPAKLRRCLAAAMRACHYEPRLADALTRAIELHLGDWSRPRPPTTDYIFRCLRTALVETGMEQVTQQLARHRRRRASQRQGVAVCDPRDPEGGLTPWRKARVARVLESRHGLGHSTARILAGEIERRVLALEYNVVSTALIAELIRSELFAWGLGEVTSETASGAPRLELAAEHQAHKE